MDGGEASCSGVFADAFNKVEVWVDGVLGGWGDMNTVGEGKP